MSLPRPSSKRWFEYRHLITFGDTNVVGNTYFAHYFVWQGKCREALMAEFYPEFEQDLQRGFGLITEFAHVDFHHECRLFDKVIVRLTVANLSRTRIEFEFEYVREKDGLLLANGRQAVIWVNPQQRPSLMPDKLYNLCRDHFTETAEG